MRLIFTRCSVDYSGRLDAHLEVADRLIMIKADGSVLVHADTGSYKPLNWMMAPNVMSEREPSQDELDAGITSVWEVRNTKTDDKLVICIYEIYDDIARDLGIEPGLVKDGVEAHLQKLLAEQVDRVEKGAQLVRREYPTAIGPVDLMVQDSRGGFIAVEIKRRGEIDGVEQLTRYMELLGRDPLLQPIRGVFAAQEIKPQARTLAEDRGLECLILDYDDMRGLDNVEDRLF
ncbi:endonuclease NucS [Actinotignum urinale]|uniref:Endonuclease NucS n=1 Tax=Actinotignum urinale TaxID=190146 RepID=A0AAW9HXZ6_9ACTO|nr:endonuclease NucS [Actinotignum urinale]MDY5132882.1 endonuclease NucS [Actinotignum urinale]MDY5151614.1 endonuclease NucS [Actinotignum urinale]MDY5155262.1 endonuclease NucS [Actinotignum urinale]WIK59382.1 endonuclease NucS [Actinotignum urinale]